MTLFAIFFATTELIRMTNPVCCYWHTDLISIMEKRDCLELAAKDPNISYEKPLADNSCIKK